MAGPLGTDSRAEDDVRDGELGLSGRGVRLVCLSVRALMAVGRISDGIRSAGASQSDQGRAGRRLKPAQATRSSARWAAHELTPMTYTVPAWDDAL